MYICMARWHISMYISNKTNHFSYGVCVCVYVCMCVCVFVCVCDEGFKNGHDQCIFVNSSASF